MRRSKTDLRARVNGDLQLEFADVALTSYAGLELFGRYLRTTGFNATVRTACAGTPGWGDFGAVAMVRLLIGLVVVGAGGCATSPSSRMTRCSDASARCRSYPRRAR